MDLNFYISLKLDQISLNDLDENISLENVKSKLSLVYKNEIQDYNVIHKGQILNDKKSLKDLGLLPGAMIYCLPKCDNNPPPAVPLSFLEVKQLVVSLRTSVSKSNFRNFIEKLRTPEQIARLIAECPSLAGDPASLAYVQNADLVKSLQQADSVSKLVKKKPILGRALQVVCKFMATDSSSSPAERFHVNYSLDVDSDEEMEVDRSDDGAGSSSQLITPAQLTAALANATSSSSSNWSGGLATSAPPSELVTPSSTPFNTPAPTSGSGAAGGASPGGSIITTEMFNQALQNAISVSSRPGGTTGGTTGTSSSSSHMNPPLENIEESLQLMAEMGLPDRELSLQALQASNGDVGAAVNLIFSQWTSDD